MTVSLNIRLSHSASKPFNKYLLHFPSLCRKFGKYSGNKCTEQKYSYIHHWQEYFAKFPELFLPDQRTCFHVFYYTCLIHVIYRIRKILNLHSELDLSERIVLLKTSFCQQYNISLTTLARLNSVIRRAIITETNGFIHAKIQAVMKYPLKSQTRAEQINFYIDSKRKTERELGVNIICYVTDIKT